MSQGSPLRFLVLASVGLLALATCAGCGDSSSGTGTVTVRQAWARSSAGGETTGAVYMSIKGGATPDALLSATVPNDVAQSAELHHTMTMSHSGSGMSDMTEMLPVSSIVILKGKSVSLSPGGYHLMLVNLVKPLTVGQTFTVSLTFDKAGQMDVPVEVRAA